MVGRVYHHEIFIRITSALVNVDDVKKSFRL